MGKLLQMDLRQMVRQKKLYALSLLAAIFMDLIFNSGGFLLTATVIMGTMVVLVGLPETRTRMDMMLPIRIETVVAEKYVLSVGTGLIWCLVVYGIYGIGMQLTGHGISQMEKVEMVMLLNLLPWISIIGIPMRLKNFEIEGKAWTVIEITMIALYVAGRIWSVRNLNVSDADTSLNLHAAVIGSAGGLLLAMVGLAVSYQISIRIIQKEDL